MQEISYFKTFFGEHFWHCIHLARAWKIDMEGSVTFVVSSKPQDTARLSNHHRSLLQHTNSYYFTSGAVAVDSSHMSASSSPSWSRFSPPSNVVNGHVLTVWFRVCRWSQSQEGDWARPRLCKLAQARQ